MEELLIKHTMNILYEVATMVILPGALLFTTFYIIKGKEQLKFAHRFYRRASGNEQAKKDDKITRYLDEEKSIHLDKVINTFLIDKKPFLRQKYSLGEMSKDLDIPLHYLSAFINRHYNMNFNELINRYRVSYSKLMIMNDEWKSKKLSTIAAEAGFHNRNTFTTAFKKETGESPSEYVSRIKRGKLNVKSVLTDVEKALIGNVA